MRTEQPSRPPRRSGSGASPMGSTLAIVIAVAAVVVGFLILNNIRRDDNSDATTPTIASSTTVAGALDTVAPLPTQPQVTVFTPTTTGAKVLVANSSHANGVAKVLTTALQGKGFTMGEATNGASKE